MAEHWLPDTCAALLAEARYTISSIETLPANLAPPSEAEAYGVQRLILEYSHDSIGGWKVGAKTPTAGINGGLLPARGIHPSGAVLDRKDFHWIGLELEIAFRLGHDLPASKAPYTDAEILSSVKDMVPTIELVTSRIRPNPENPRCWAIADLLNHGALIVGDPIPYDPTYPFLAPSLTWIFNSQNVAPANPPTNPAGDPRRLLAWAVNHCCLQGWDFQKEMLITAGTFTGVFKPTDAGEAVGHFAGLGEVRLNLR
jgi:2-keto-4-pentenoate hydratase